jgi:hypothetical protein
VLDVVSSSVSEKVPVRVDDALSDGLADRVGLLEELRVLESVLVFEDEGLIVS